MFMKNKLLIAANLECHRKEKGLRVSWARGGSEGTGTRGIDAGGPASPRRGPFLAGGAKKMLKKYERSRNVYENKQISDTMPGKISDIFVLVSDIYV
jgi:hypothetical protein